jgi:hypothetical protein
MLKRQLKNYLSDCVLTLSCEILLSAKNPGTSFATSGEMLDALHDRLGALRELYPFITVRIISGINELNVKLFSHEERLADENFLDNFRFYLEEALEKILGSGAPAVRINAFGHYSNAKSRYSFRYMNKGREVKYKIIEETPYAIVCKRKFQILALLIALIGFFGWIYIKTGYPVFIEKFGRHWPFTQESVVLGPDV